MSPPAGRDSRETGMEVRAAQRSRDPAMGLEQEGQGDCNLEKQERESREAAERDGGIT